MGHGVKWTVEATSDPCDEAQDRQLIGERGGPDGGHSDDCHDTSMTTPTSGGTPRESVENSCGVGRASVRKFDLRAGQ